MQLRSLAAAIGLSAILSLGLAGCVTNPDGSVVLDPSARVKLESASKWAHRVSAGASLTIVGIKVACEGNVSSFCDKALPIVGQATAALVLYDSALAKADAALDNTGTPEEQLAAAAASLIELESDVEDFLRQLRNQ